MNPAVALDQKRSVIVVVYGSFSLFAFKFSSCLGIDCVAEELYAPTEESRVEEADLFSDPEDDLHHRICEVQRSLSLDSEGTEPEAQAGNVLSKVAFFETFQRSFEAPSPSNSQSSFRRSLIEDKPEEWSCTPGQEVHREEEEEYDNEEEQKKDLQQEQDEPECQLEFDDLFPAHVEGDETEAHEDMFEDEGGADEESLVSVSDTEDLADFGYYDDRPEGVQDYELQDTRFETVEFVEDDPSAMEIFEFSDEDASHQYSDVTEHEGKPNLLKPTVLTPMNLDSASECSESQSCETCEHERADVIEDHPYSCDEESFETSEADVEIPGHLSSRTSDPDQCVATAKREDVDIRLKELISNFGLLPVDESPKESDELSDFNETREGQLVQNILSSKADVKLVEERTPIDEIYEASNKCTVESEIDFDELVTRIERKETEYDDVGANEDGTISDTSKETEKADSVDIVYASVRDHEKECDDEIERVSSELGLEPPKSSKQKNSNKLAMATDVILEYESQLLVAQDGMEPVSENVEAVERRLEPENASDPETLLDRLQSATQEEEVARHEVINDGTSESSKSIESFDVVIRDHLQERESILEEFGLVRVSPDISSIGDEPTEPLPYEHTPQLNFQELPEVTEDISAEVREEVRSEINFEELFSSFGENRDISTTKESPDTYHFDTSKESFVIMGEEKPYESVWRDLDNERGKDLDKIAFQLDVVADSSKEEVSCDSIEPLPYSLAPKASPEKEVSEVSESITTEVRRDVRCQINFEEAFRNLEEDDSVQEDSTQDNQLSEQVEEIGFEKTSDVALDDKKSAMGDEAVLIPPSSPQRISYEGKNYYPAEQVREQKRLSSLYSKEITIGKDETVETPFSARHRATDGENLGHPDIAYKSHRLEKEIESAPSADDKHEVVTEVLSEHIALQGANTGSSEEIGGKIHTENENQDTFPSQDNKVIEEMKPVVYCSSHPVVNEFDDATQLEKEPLDSMAHEDQFLETIAGEALAEKTEIDKQAVDEKHALLFTEEAAAVSDVSTDVSSFRRNDAECVQNERVEEINAEEIDEKEEENSTVNVVAPETQSLLESVSGVTQHTESFDEINKEPSGESKDAAMSFEEAVTVREVTSDIPSSLKDIPGGNHNIESFDEIDEEPSEEGKQASLHLDEAVTLHKVATDAHSSQKDVSEKSRNVESFEEIDLERSKESRKACMSFEEAAALDEATRDSPSGQKHVYEEGQNVESLEGIDVKPSEEREEESTSLKEAVALDEVESDIPTSPKHVPEERQNVDSFKEIDEEASEDSKQASMSFEKSVNLEDETSVITTSPKQVSGEIKDLEGCEESNEEPIEESKEALMSFEEAVTLYEVTSNTSYSPRKLSGETQNMESLEEIDEESTEESKQASMSFEEAVTLHEVTSNAPSSPKPLSEESQNEESFEEIDEERNEESKEATMSFEEAVTLREVTSNAPSSPKPLSEESQNEESFEEIDEERNEESKEATMSFEEAVTLREVTSNAPSSPKPLSEESQNEESFEEIDEERNEESKEATMSFEEAVTLREVTSNAPSSPKPLSEESQNEESFEEIDEERNEESKEATMSFEEAVTLREVTSNAPSSPKPLSEESQNEESFEEIDEERNEESKEATMSFEEAVTLHEVTCNVPSSPKPLSEESQNEESFEEIDEERNEESKEATMSFVESVTLHEVTSNASSSPKPLSKESQNEESFEEIDEERNEESKEATMSFEEAVTLHEVTSNAPSSPKPLSKESQNEESFEEIDEERNEESKDATMSFEEAVTLREVTSNVPSSPKPLSEESQNEEGLEEIDEERNEESKEATMSFEDAVTLHEGKRDALSSPKDGSEENQNKESFDENDDEEATEESKEASMSLEEAVTLGEVTGDALSSPKHGSEESQNVESCEDVKRELIEECKPTLLYFEEAVIAHEDSLSSPVDLVMEDSNAEKFGKADEQASERTKRTSLLLEGDLLVKERAADVPSSPKHVTGESGIEGSTEEIEKEVTLEQEQASPFIEESETVDNMTGDAASSPAQFGGETFEEAGTISNEQRNRPWVSLKEEEEEEDSFVDEIATARPSFPMQTTGEFSNIETLEVTGGNESPESDYGEMFEEFEHTYDTAEFAERANVAGEIGIVANNSNGIEEVVRVEEDLEFEESHEAVTTTDALETPQCPLHIAGEVSNKEQKEESSEEEQAVKEAFAREFQDEMTHTSVFSLKSPQSLLRIAAEALENKIDSARQDSIDEETLAAEAEQPGRTEGRANLQQAFSETIPADADVVGELDDSSQHEEAGQTEVTSEQSPADFEDTDTTDSERDASVPIILVDIAAEVSDVEDENLVFVELESQKDSEEVTETQDCCEEAVKECPPDGQESSESPAVKQDCREKTVLECAPDGQETSESQIVKQDCPEEAATECAPDGQETSESQAVKQDCREEAVSEYPSDDQEISGSQTVKQDCWEEAVSECAPDGQETSESQAVAEVCLSELGTLQEDKMESRETVEPFEESEEGSVSEFESFSFSSPVSTEIKDFSDYEPTNEEYVTEPYNSIFYEEGEFVSDKSKGLPSQLKSKELGLQELHKEKNDKGLVQDDVEEPLQGHKIWQHLETNAEFSDLSFTDDGIVEEEEQAEKEEEELSQRDFAERFIDIGGLNDETTGKDYSRSQQEYFKEIQPWDETADSKAQEFEREENLVTIERSSTERKAIVLTYSEGASVQKEMEILEYSKQVESNTEQQIVEKREVTQVQKFSLNGEKKQAFPEHSSQSLGDKESFSVCQTESLIVSERERHLKLSHEKEEKVEVFSTRTGQTASHVAVEFASTSTTLEYRFESNGACISRQVSSSNDNLSESILDTEIKDHEVEKFEKVLSEEETEVRLLKTEVLELKAAEHQESLPLENPHVTVERETTLVKTVVLKPSAEEAQEEVLMEEDRVTAILREDEAMLEEESTGELFEEEIDIMRMDEALSEEEFRGEGAESNELGQSRSSRVDSVGEVNKGGPFESSGEGEEGDMQNHTVLHLEGEEQSQEKIDDTDALHGSLEEFVIVCASKDSLVEISKEELEGTDLKESAAVAEEELEIVEEDEARTETPVFEEELEVLALSTGKDIIYVECTEEDNLVEHSAVYEEELEVSALKGEGEPAELELEPVTEQEEDDVNRRAVYEEELEMTAYEAQHEAFDEARQIREENEGEGPYAIEDQRNEGLDRVPHENEGAELAVEEEIEKKCDAEENLENVATIGASRQPLDLTQVDFYDQEESVTSTRYYVELSSTESLEPHYVEVDEEEAPYTETYVRQGEPLEENLEEFILVRYGDEFESSGEEDISDHREIYVIPEEENDVENHKFAGTAALAGEPVPESLYEEGFQNMGLGEIRESPEFDMDDSDELDEEEQRQLEEYERLESFVILEEKLSQVESDDDENGDLPMVEGDESVFHLDAHSSGEETLHEDELRETLTAGSLRQKTAFTETQRSQEEDMPQGGDCMHMVDDDIEEQQETPKECSPETEEPQAKEGFSFSEGSKTVSPAPTEDTKMKTDTEAPKGTFELSSTREERAEHNLSSDSSGEQCVSNDGSVSSSASLGDLEGLLFVFIPRCSNPNIRCKS